VFVAHAYNPSSLGGRNQDRGSKTAQAIVPENLS
jgi:hypothetical protein